MWSAYTTRLVSAGKPFGQTPPPPTFTTLPPRTGGARLTRLGPARGAEQKPLSWSPAPKTRPGLTISPSGKAREWWDARTRSEEETISFVFRKNGRKEEGKLNLRRGGQARKGLTEQRSLWLDHLHSITSCKPTFLH